MRLCGRAAGVDTGSDDGARGDFRRAAAMRLARLLGRQIAREHFEASRAANDNAPAGEADERQELRDYDATHRALCPPWRAPA